MVRSAARLVGYAEMHDRKMGGDAEPNERRAQELAMQRVAAALPAEEIEQPMSEGAGLSEDEVCALTLDSRG